MSRIKRGVQSNKKHKKILKKAKGYYGARSRTYRSAKQSVIKASQYAYRDRKQKKRKFRTLWIIRINAIVRQYNMKYSKFINMLKKMKIEINRKILSNITISNKNIIKKLIKLSILKSKKN